MSRRHEPLTWVVALLVAGCSKRDTGPAASPASGGTVPVADVAPLDDARAEPVIDGFAAFCEADGVHLRPDPTYGKGWREVDVNGVRLRYGFKAFPPGTSVAAMRRALTTYQLAFDSFAVNWGLALSSPGRLFPPGKPQPTPAQEQAAAREIGTLFARYATAAR